MSSEAQSIELTIPKVDDSYPVLKFIFENLFTIWVKDPLSNSPIEQSYHEFIHMSQVLEITKICIRTVLSDDDFLYERLIFCTDAINYETKIHYNTSRLELRGSNEHMPLNNIMEKVRSRINDHKIMKNHIKMTIDDIVRYFDLRREISDDWILHELAHIDTYGKSVIDTSNDIKLSELIEITQDHYNKYHTKFMTFWLSKIFACNDLMVLAFTKGEPYIILKQFATVLANNMQTTYTDKGIWARCILVQLHRYILDVERTRDSEICGDSAI